MCHSFEYTTIIAIIIFIFKLYKISVNQTQNNIGFFEGVTVSILCPADFEQKRW